MITPLTTSLLVTERWSDFSEDDDSCSTDFDGGGSLLWSGGVTPFLTVLSAIVDEKNSATGEVKEGCAGGMVGSLADEKKGLEVVGVGSVVDGEGCRMVLASLRMVCDGWGESGGSGEVGTFTHRLENNYFN